MLNLNSLGISLITYYNKKRIELYYLHFKGFNAKIKMQNNIFNLYLALKSLVINNNSEINNKYPLLLTSNPNALEDDSFIKLMLILN